MSRHRAVIGALAGVLLLAGCGSDGTPGGASSTSGQEKSPLSEYMGGDMTGTSSGFMIAVGDGGEEQPTEEQLAEQRRVEDLIAACMQAEGFRYVPVPPQANPKGKFREAFSLPPDKFAEQYGYGISTMDFEQTETDDANTRIRNSLSAAAKKEYDKALDGRSTNSNPSEGKFTAGGGPGGCRGKAIEQVYGKAKSDKGQAMRRFDSLFRDIEALRTRIQDDPKVVAAERAWADCMADAQQTGLNKPDDAREKVAQRFNQLLGVRPGQRKVQIGPDSLRNLDQTRLAGVRRYELAVAKADYACRQKGYEQTYKEVQYAAEREFIADHKTQLEQFKEFSAEGKGGR